MDLREPKHFILYYLPLAASVDSGYGELQLLAVVGSKPIYIRPSRCFSTQVYHQTPFEHTCYIHCGPGSRHSMNRLFSVFHTVFSYSGPRSISTSSAGVPAGVSRSPSRSAVSLTPH